MKNAAFHALKTRGLAQDIEAQRLPSGAHLHAAQADQPAEYAHTGRGGAGNWYSPRQTENQGRPSGDRNIDPTAVSDAELKSRPGGRGGAGNIEFGRQVEERRRTEPGKESQANQTELHERIAHDVESGLAMPEKAFLGRQ